MLDQIRQTYKNAKDDSSQITQLKNLLTEFEKSDHSQALCIAYQGALAALEAKNAWLPFTKLTYLQSALDIFRKAVRLAPDNIEVRFLRITVQKNIPAFLGLDAHIEEDKMKILNHIHDESTDLPMRKVIAVYLLQNLSFTPSEKQILENI
jgi:hypothetical protein